MPSKDSHQLDPLTVVTSIPALALKEPVLTDPSILQAPGGETAPLWAVLLEIILAASCIGTACGSCSEGVERRRVPQSLPHEM